MKSFKGRMGSNWSFRSIQTPLLESPVHNAITNGEYYRNDEPSYYNSSPRKDGGEGRRISSAGGGRVHNNNNICVNQNNTGVDKLSVRGFDNLCYLPNDEDPIFYLQPQSKDDLSAVTDDSFQDDDVSILRKTTLNLRRSLSLRRKSFRGFKRQKGVVLTNEGCDSPPVESVVNPIIYSPVLKNYDINYFPSSKTSAAQILKEESVSESSS